MSAISDKNQKITFVYSNLYQLYKKGTEAAKKGQVLKAGILAAPAPAVAPQVQIRAYEPIELLRKRVEAVETAKQAHRTENHATIENLKGNLRTLNDLHSRLRFMLQELEDLIKK